MVESGLGILARSSRIYEVTQRFAFARGVARHEMAHEIGDVLVRTGQHVLQAQEVGAQILRFARQETQELGQAAQHAHLPFARRAPARAALGTAQTLEQADEPAGRLAHVERAELGHAHDLARRHATDHGVRSGPRVQKPRLERFHMIFQKDHVGHHDVGPCDVLATTLCGTLVLVPFGEGVQRQVQSRQIALQQGSRAIHGGGHVTVQCDDGHADGRALPCVRATGHSEPLHRRGFRV